MSSSGIIDELSKKLSIDLIKEKEILDPKLVLKLQGGVGFSKEPENCCLKLEIFIWKKRKFSDKILSGENPSFDSNLEINLSVILFYSYLGNIFPGLDIKCLQIACSCCKGRGSLKVIGGGWRIRFKKSKIFIGNLRKYVLGEEM